MKIRIRFNGKEAEAELNKTITARKIYDALPIKSNANTWGGEIYFDMNLLGKASPKIEEENAKEEVEIGDLGYWLQGSCFCIFFGRTPVSTNDKPRAASKVNVFGKVTKGLEVLKKINSGESVRIEMH